MIDLGLNGATVVADATTAGGTYDLSSLFDSSTFTTAFGTDASALNNVCAGVVGGYFISNPKLLYQTVAIGVTPAALSSGGLVNGAAGAAQGVGIGEYSSGADTTTGWSGLVSANANTPGSIVSGSSVSGYTGINAVGNLSSGILSSELWENDVTPALARPLAGLTKAPSIST